MKILKYKKVNNNEYKIETTDNKFKLYDDIIIKYELLLKKEIDEKELEIILKENNLIKAYYESLKYISVKLRTENEIDFFLKKKNYNNYEINYAINRLKNENYLNRQVYIEAYVHDMLNLYIVGEDKILSDLVKLGFNTEEVNPYLEKIDKELYLDKIERYIDKKLKVNKKSSAEFKRKTLNELLNRGFLKSDILKYLDNLNVEENENEIEKIVLKLYKKYINKYDLFTTKLKIKSYLYSKGYSNINLDKYIEKTSD